MLLIRLYILCFCTLFFNLSFGQYLTHAKYHGGNEYDHISKTIYQDGFTYVLGNTNSTNFSGPNNLSSINYQVPIISKFDSLGNLLYTHQINNKLSFGDYSDFKIFNDTAYVVNLGVTSYINGISTNIYYTKYNLNTGQPIFIDSISGVSSSIDYPNILIDSLARNIYITLRGYNLNILNPVMTNSLFNNINNKSSLYYHFDGNSNQLLFSSTIPQLISDPIIFDNKLYFETFKHPYDSSLYLFSLDALTDTIIDDYIVQNNTLNNYNEVSRGITLSPNNTIIQNLKHSITGMNILIQYDDLLNIIDTLNLGNTHHSNRFYTTKHIRDKIYATYDSINALRFKIFDNSGNIVTSQLYPELKNSIVFAKDNFIYIVGESEDFPTTNGSLGSSNSDALTFLKIDTFDYNICYSTYVGGVDIPIAHNDPYTNGIILMNAQLINNDIHLIGTSEYQKMPKTEGQIYGNRDFYYAIFEPNLTITPIKDTLITKTQTVCKNGMAEIILGNKVLFQSDDSIPLVYFGNTAHEQVIGLKTNYQWQEATNINGPYTDIPNANNKDHLPIVEEHNKYYRRISFMDNCDNNYTTTSDTTAVLVNNFFAPQVEIGNIYHTCPNVAVTVGINPTAISGTPPYQYNWSNGDTTPTIISNSAKNELYTLIVTDSNECRQYDQANVLAHKAEIIQTDYVCAGDSATLRAKTIPGLIGVGYSWIGSNMCCGSSAINKVAPAYSRYYTLTQTIPITGGGTCSTNALTFVENVPPPPDNFAGPDRLECLGTKVTVGIPALNGFNYSWDAISDARISPTNQAQAVLTSFYDIHNQSNYFTNLMPSINPFPVIATMQWNNCLYTDTAYIAFMEAVEEDSRIFYCEADLIGHPDRTPNIDETYEWSLLNGLAQITGPTNQVQLQIDNSPTLGSSTFQLTTTATVNGLTNSCTNNVIVYENYTKFTSNASCFPITYKGITYTSDAVIWDTIPSTTENCDTIHKHEINITNCVSFCQFESNGIKSITARYTLSSNTTYNYDWSVEIGPTTNVNFIDRYKVEILDDIYRQIKLTITSPSDTTLLLEYFMDVNGGSWDPISYTALDTSLCYPVGGIRIGDPNGGGYSYDWGGPNNFNSGSSNPYVTPPNIGINNYSVRVQRGGCSLYDIATINVIKLDEKYAGIDLEVCENSYITLGNPENPSDYHYKWEPNSALWQSGTDSSSANPELLVAVSADYIVYVADADSFCTASDTVSITVNNSPTLDIPDFDICRNEDAIIGVPGFSGASFSWLPATGLSCTDCISPTVNLENSQIYTVNILFDGNCVNPNFTDLVNINVIEVSSNMQDINYCPDGSSVILGTDAPIGMNNYIWTPSSLMNSPSNRVSSVRNPNGQTTQSFYLKFIDNNQCEVFDTVNIIPNISQPPVNAGNNRTICLNESTQLGEATFSPTATYSWSPNTFLSNSNIANPIFTGQETGTFTFTLSKQDSIGNCITTDEITIQVKSPSIENQTYLICKNTCQAIGFLPENNILYTWYPSSGLSDANIPNPVACNLTQSTSFSVTALDNFGCEANATVNVSVFNNTVPNIIISDTLFFTNTPSSLTVNVSPANNFIYNWGTSPYILDNTTKEGLFSFPNPGTYNFTLEVIDPLNGCVTSKNVTILVLEKIFYENPIIGCDSVIFRNQTYFQNHLIVDEISVDTLINNRIIVNHSENNNFNIPFCDSIQLNNAWFFNDTILVDSLFTKFGCDSIVTITLIKNISSPITKMDTSFCANEKFEYILGNQTITSSGVYNYNFTNQNGCDSLFELTVTEKPIQLFNESILDTTICFGDTIPLNPNIVFSDSLNYNWEYANNTTIVLTESYTDLLTITHPNNCQQTIPLNAFFKDCVGPCKLMLPTGFSPNNDGVNDQLVIFNDCRYGIEKFNIKVYNRWGELIFESDDMLNTWDGYYKNQPAPLGVYTYHITYTKVASDKTDTLSGNVTLIK